MPTLKIINANGTEHVVDAEEGASVMQAALTNGIPGIDAECGGAASCATCHVYVDDAWVARCGPPGDDENDMLDCAASERLPNSRLSCQIDMTAELDGLIVRTPETQS